MRLILSLKPKEVQLIKDYYSIQSNGRSYKKLKLFNLIQQRHTSDNQGACLKLYDCKPNSAFCHLKKRLERDILNFMLLGPTTFDSPTDEISEELNCRKSLMQGKILISRGIYDAGISLINKTFKLAEKYEFPDLKLAAIDILRKYDQAKSGFSKSKYYSEQMDSAYNMFGKILKAKEINYRVTSNGNNSVSSPVNPPIKKSLAKLTDYYRPGTSKRAHYWYETALIEHYFQQKNFNAARNFTLHLLKFLEQEPVLESCTRKAELYLKFAEISIHLREYEDAVKQASKSMSLFPADSIDSIAGLKVLFFAHYRNREYAHARKVYDRAIHHQHMTPSLIYQWNMFKAALNFDQANYGLVRTTLHSNSHLKQRKSGWVLGSRLLELLNILELQDYDWFEFKLESFGKKLSRLKSRSYTRFNMIHQLLRVLMKSNYCYHQTIDKKRDCLRELEEDNAALYWDPMGSELINFSSWLTTKVQK